MPNYVLLLMGTEDWVPEDYTAEDFDAEMALHVKFQEAVVAAGGKVVASQALVPSKDAVLITNPGSDSPVFTDGPFSEIKEIANGYYEFEVPRLRDREARRRDRSGPERATVPGVRPQPAGLSV